MEIRNSNNMSKSSEKLIQELKDLAQTHGVDSAEVSQFITDNSNVHTFKLCVDLALAFVASNGIVVKHNGRRINKVEDRPSPMSEER